MTDFSDAFLGFVSPRSCVSNGLIEDHGFRWKTVEVGPALLCSFVLFDRESNFEIFARSFQMHFTHASQNVSALQFHPRFVLLYLDKFKNL